MTTSKIIIKRYIPKAYPRDELHQWAIFRTSDLPSPDIDVVKHLSITPLVSGCTKPVVEEFFRYIMTGNLNLREKAKKRAS